jgi:hypothetical protein
MLGTLNVKMFQTVPDKNNKTRKENEIILWCGKDLINIITKRIKVTNKITIIDNHNTWLESNAVSYRQSDYMARKSYCKL